MGTKNLRPNDSAGDFYFQTKTIYLAFSVMFI